tara:strand:- start:171 stop:434 length:264 start_codon:yes stop_codon:yes gene_type:complete
MLKFKIVKSVLILSNNALTVEINENNKTIAYITNDKRFIESLYVNRLSSLYRALDLLTLSENKSQQDVNDLLARHVSNVESIAQQAS